MRPVFTIRVYSTQVIKCRSNSQDTVRPQSTYCNFICDCDHQINTSSVTTRWRSPLLRTSNKWSPPQAPSDSHALMQALPSLHIYTLVRSCHVWNQGQSERRSTTFCVFRSMIMFCTLQRAQVLYIYICGCCFSPAVCKAHYLQQKVCWWAHNHSLYHYFVLNKFLFKPKVLLSKIFRLQNGGS